METRPGTNAKGTEVIVFRHSIKRRLSKELVAVKILLQGRGGKTALLRRDGTKRVLFTALRVVITILLSALAVRAVRWDEFAKAFHDTAPLVILSGAGIYALLQCLSATRWWTIAKASGLPFLWRDTVAAFYTGMFFNLFLPGLVGGDAVKAVLLARRTETSTATTLGTVYADRTVGFLAMVMVGIWGMATLPSMSQRIAWTPLLVGALSALIVTTLIIFGGWMFSRWHPGRWGERVSRFTNGIIAFASHPCTGLSVFSIALAYHLSLTATLMVLGKGIGIIGQPLSAYAFVVAVTTVIGALPISLHGLGVRELASVQLWGLLGVAPEKAFLWAVLWRVMVWIVALPGGFVYLLWADRTVWQDLQTMSAFFSASRQPKPFM